MSRNILITGGSGHIGSRLLETALELGYLVAAPRYDLPNMAEGKLDYDTVIHLAAFVPKTEDDFEQSVEVNLKGTMNLVRSLREGTKMVFISTCEVYGIPVMDVIDENHPLNPLTYYGMSKVAAENILRIYCKKNNIDLVILRLTNVYGPGETISRAIPNFIKSVMNNTDIIIFGDGEDKRDFIYIDDAVGYILAAIEAENGVYNIASGKSYSIRLVANKIIELSEKDLQIVYTDRETPMRDYVFDITRARSLEYVIETEIAEGLKKEIEWYEEENIL